MIIPKRKRSVAENEGVMEMKHQRLESKVGELVTVKKARLTKTQHTANGTLYEGSKVTIEQFSKDNQKIRVSDATGRIFWISPKDVKLD
jgi:hypothetical protein